MISSAKRATLTAMLAVLPLLSVTAPLVAKPIAKPKKPVASVMNDDAPVAVTYGRREDVMQLAAEIAQRQQLDPAWVTHALEHARFIPSIGKLMMPPPAGTAKNWGAYQARFIEPRRIRAGLMFWQAHEKWLNQAEDRWGVPPEIIVGIIGVETLYGQHIGNFRVIDALATLSFDFPSGRRDRSGFFRDELEQFLMLAQREGWDPLSIKGSFAGAIGMPQFMPSSLLKYALDFDEDGRIDLRQNAADVIGSVAHYLSAFGWLRDLPAYFPLTAIPSNDNDLATLLAPDILPTFSAQDLIQKGIMLPAEALSVDGKLALIELQNGGASPSYVVGTSNFYTVTRYNWSSYYAMAVIELGKAIRTAREASLRTAQTSSDTTPRAPR